MTGKTDAFLLSGKDIMGVFDEVKKRVTARAVMERAGIVFNRSNMCKCPFHQDKTASMKVKPADKKYFCFGCGEKGDAIDFVARYYNLSPKDAAMQIADEFGIAYDSSVWSPPKPVRKEKSPMQILAEAKTKTYRVLSDYFHLLKEWERDLARRIWKCTVRYSSMSWCYPTSSLSIAPRLTKRHRADRAVTGRAKRRDRKAESRKPNGQPDYRPCKVRQV